MIIIIVIFRYLIGLYLDIPIMTEKQSSQIVFITNQICPFAHRAWLVLEELNIPYTLQKVPIFRNDPQLKKIYKTALGHDQNSNGKVPVLIDGDFVLAQSSLIVQYLYNKYGGSIPNQLKPSPELQIKAKIFSQKYRKIIGHFYQFRKWHHEDSNQKQNIVKKMNQDLQKLNQDIQLPYALGNKFTTADIMIYPWLLRWIAIEKHIGISIGKQYTKIHQWIENIEKRQSYKKTKSPAEYYIKGYQSYFVRPSL